MILEAFAKINWSLDITGLREDGYHLVDMLMQPVSIADEITLEPYPAVEISTGGWPHTRADSTNLAYRAAMAIKERTGYPHGVHIHIHKKIPMGAGMGGGSTDASAVLIGLNRLWNTRLSSSELEEIGLTLGADVPFFIRGGLSRTRGIGENLERYDCLHNYWMIVIQPCSGLSTARVFSIWPGSGYIRRPDTEAALLALKSGNLDDLCLYIGNVLQPVSESLRPEIISACSSLLRQGAAFAEMTGSGSAVFGVFRSSASARKAYQNLAAAYNTIFLCHTQSDSIRIKQD